MPKFTPRRRNYNLNTKYGRKKANEQARWNYENGDQKYRDDIDRYTRIFWTILIIFLLLGFLIVGLIKKH